MLDDISKRNASCQIKELRNGQSPCKLSSKLTSLDFRVRAQFTLAPTGLPGGPQTGHICSEMYLSHLSSRAMAPTSGDQHPKACNPLTCLGWLSAGTRFLLFPSAFSLGRRNEVEHVGVKDGTGVEVRGGCSGGRGTVVVIS